MVRAQRSRLRLARGLGLAALFAWPGSVAAAGRWFAWLDRVPAALEAQGVERWAARGVRPQSRASAGFLGQEPGFVHLVTIESLFRAEAQAGVDALQAQGLTQAGLQFFSDAVPAAVRAALPGAEPAFAVEVELDGVAPAEHVALVRDDSGDRLVVIRAHVDGSMNVQAQHATGLRGLPRVTEGDRADVWPLDGTGRKAIVYRAAFLTPEQQSLWSFVFVFDARDTAAAPRMFFVPGARAPVSVQVDFRATAEGFGWQVSAAPLGGRAAQSSTFLWNGETFASPTERLP